MRALNRVLTLAAVAVVTLGLPAQQRVLGKQEEATRAFESLTEKMQKLTVALKATDPDKAQV